MSKKKRGNFELTDEQKRELAQLELVSRAAQAKKIDILRKAARESRIASESLNGLESKSGRPFIEVEEALGGYRQAVCKTKSRNRASDELAYLCRPRYMPDGPGCGWVIGEPVEERYDEIGLMTGSAGTRYYCRICGQEIGEYASMHSFI